MSRTDTAGEAPQPRDRAAGFVLVLLGAASGLEAMTFNVAFMTDPVGPKALPLLVAATLVGAGARMIIRPRPTAEFPHARDLRRIALAAAAFITYALALPWPGFFVSTPAVIATLGKLFDGPRRGSVLAGATLSAALWLLFVTLLSLPLPIGALWIR